MLGELFQSSFSTYCKAFEESFKENFGFINRYRDILKAIEMVRFQIFDKKFEEKVNALVNKMSYTDSNGNRIEYNPTNAELDNILKELVDEGFGHVIRDINGVEISRYVFISMAIIICLICNKYDIYAFFAFLA